MNVPILNQFATVEGVFVRMQWLKKSTLLLFLFFMGLGTLTPNPSFAQKESEEDLNVPKTVPFKFKGYFRFRGDIMNNFALGVSERATVDPLTSRDVFGSFPFYHPISAYPFLNEKLTQGKTAEELPKTHSGANLRLRLLAQFDVAEKIQIFTTLDLLDNLVLGSTPRGDLGMLQDPGAPLTVFSGTQTVPTMGLNGFSDSIKVRHVYASIKTPVGLLRLGRMPSSWGLGILANDGMKLNSNYGDTVDRVMFITKLFDYLFVVAGMDMVSTGPTSAGLNQWQFGQPFDLDPADDARQFIFALSHKTLEPELANRMENGENIINYGFYFVIRQQAQSSECVVNAQGVCTTRADIPSSVNQRGLHPAFVKLNPRNAAAYIPDIWFRYLKGETMRIELEAVMIFGTIGNGPNGDPIDVLQWGAALEFEYRFLEDGPLRLGVNMGIASGDNDFISRWKFNFDSDGKRTDPNTPVRGAVNNYQFDPDYQIDMILWRELYGTFTNGFYTKVSINYNIYGDPWSQIESDGLAIKLAAIYSQALNINSTLGKASPLGVELNGLINWKSGDGYSFVFAYGLLIPLEGLNYAIWTDPVKKDARSVQATASIAHRFEFRLAIAF